MESKNIIESNNNNNNKNKDPEPPVLCHVHHTIGAELQVRIFLKWLPLLGHFESIGRKCILFGVQPSKDTLYTENLRSFLFGGHFEACR